MRDMLKKCSLALVLLSLAITVMFLSGFAASNESDRVSITLCYNNYRITYIDELIRSTNHLVTEEIHNRKINAGYQEKMNQVDMCLFSGADYKSALLYSFPLLKNTVDTATNKINCLPVNSVIKFYPDKANMFSISKEKDGARVDENVLYQNIYFALRRDQNIKISITPRVLSPDITYEDNLKLTGLRAKFSTYYGASGEGRKHNIELSLKRINGTTLLPNEEFSFNKIAGKRTLANGYKEAIIIKQGKYVDGVGGGVCQASTTVYNCALLSDMEIISARNHSLEPSYVWPSFDAMVSGATDLKFKNSGDFPVFIKAYGNGQNAVVEIYGSPLPYKILRRSEEICRETPPLDDIIVDTQYQYFDKDVFIEPGTKKRVWFSKGELRSKGYLIYYSNDGRYLEKKQIRSDIYKSTNGLIAVAP